MKRVPVVDKNNVPLMPTKCSKARKLIRDGKAIGKWNKLGQYYIQLTFEPSGRETQPIAAGLDPGIGIQSSKVTLFTAHLILPFETVKKRMEQRRIMRRSRRGRRINRKLPFELRSHHQCRFSNRRNKKVAPSIRANRQLEIRVISELCKVYPISSIIYEYVKADVDLTSGRKKARSGKGFSAVMVGQKWAIQQLSKLAPVATKVGWQTSNLRKHLGLEKQKHSKGDAIAATHGVDGVALAASQFIDYLPFENSEGRGHCWKGAVTITDAIFTVIRRPPISRRQLHLMIPAKGGVRRKYGGTTTPFNIRKGDIVKYKDQLGFCSGYTGKSISVSDFNWKRLGRFAANKVILITRSTNLICQPIIGGAEFP
ncbi:MAG: RRXRR domain-containing protein [Xenococcus sp. MO_188.B8]|nr:RRXRR domain-containing protein [Xenococcus sp. MO_188.B8]